MRVHLFHSLFLVNIEAGVVGPPGTATLDQNTAIFFVNPEVYVRPFRLVRYTAAF